jgi:hypothetical protein
LLKQFENRKNGDLSSKLLISDHWIGLDKVYVFVLIEEIKMVATFEYRSYKDFPNRVLCYTISHGAVILDFRLAPQTHMNILKSRK